MQPQDINLYKAYMSFNSNKIDDIPTAVHKALQNAAPKIPTGGKIAVAVGSRGIANLSAIVRQVCAFVKEQGANPFIVPAMGSHGGATAEGQTKVLAGYGVTEQQVGAPILSSMQVVEINNSGLPNQVFMDKLAWESDGVIAIGRIKPHTDFSSDIESGLAKMCVIGLGKHRQALEMHSMGTYGLANYIAPSAQRILEQGKILLGLGIVENGYDETALVRAFLPDELLDGDRELLKIARSLMAALPVGKIDILIVDRMGKDISGTGLDTNIIGRKRIEGAADPDYPDITHIIVDDLSDISHGNAIGVGLADFITRKLFNKIDFKDTYENTLTSTFIDRARIPLVAEHARQAFGWSFRAQARLQPELARIIRIKSTLEISEIYLSRPLIQDLHKNQHADLSDTPHRIFLPNGDLQPF